MGEGDDGATTANGDGTAPIDPLVLEDLLDMVDAGLHPRGSGTRPDPSDRPGRILEAQLAAYEALGRLNQLMREVSGLPSVMHPSAPDRLAEPWMDWTREAMGSLSEATWRLGQALRAGDIGPAVA